MKIRGEGSSTKPATKVTASAAVPVAKGQKIVNGSIWLMVESDVDSIVSYGTGVEIVFHPRETEFENGDFKSSN